MCIHASVGGAERQCGFLSRKFMKKILNETKDGVCHTITVHYHKEGVSNIIGGGSSIILSTAVLEYEDEDEREDIQDCWKQPEEPIQG